MSNFVIVISEFSAEIRHPHDSVAILFAGHYQRWAPAIFSLVRFRWSAIYE
jgi:hypothetical protein